MAGESPTYHEDINPQEGASFEGNPTIEEQRGFSSEVATEGGEVKEEVQELLGDFEGLEDKEGNEISGFDVFSQFILTTPQGIQEKFIDFETSLVLENNIKNIGDFPVNIFEFESFIIEGYSVEQTAEQREQTAEQREQTAEQREQTAEQREQTAEQREQVIELTEAEIISTEIEKQKLISLKDNLSGIDLSDDTLINLLNQVAVLPTIINLNIGASNVERLSEGIINSLSSSRELEKNILPQARAAGNYEEVKNSLIDLGGGENGEGGVFAQRILEWELGERTETLPREQQIRTRGALGIDGVGDIGTQAERSGNIFTLRTDTGEEIDYNVVSNERFLSRDGYSLSSQVEDSGDYQTPKLEYMRVEQEHLPKIQIIQEISRILEEKGVEVDELAEIRETIRQIPGSSELGINFENFSSGEEIQNALRLSLQGHLGTLQEARSVYQNALEGLQAGYMSALERKDKKVKETLRFLESIGFTQIPQYITDQIVDTLNSNSALRAQLGFTERLDFENGQLGMDTVAGESSEIDRVDKVAFAQFVNQMIGTEAINIEALRNGTGAPVGDRNKFRTILRESGILNVGGVGIIMNNLNTHGTEEK